MRLIAGALLIVAAAILAGASILAEATAQSQGGLGNHATMGYVVAAALALLGLFVGAAGFAEYQRHQLPRHQRHLMYERHDH
jgi:hypothetical protein